MLQSGRRKACVQEIVFCIKTHNTTDTDKLKYRASQFFLGMNKDMARKISPPAVVLRRSLYFLYLPAFLLLAGLALLVMGISNQTGRSVLRAAVPVHAASTELLTPFGAGFEEDLLRMFCEVNACSLVFVPMRGHAEALRVLRGGYVDVAVGFSGEPGADARVVHGPVYYRAGKVTVDLPPLREKSIATKAPWGAASRSALADFFSKDEKGTASQTKGKSAAPVREMSSSGRLSFPSSPTRETSHLLVPPGRPDPVQQAHLQKMQRLLRMDSRSWALWEPVIYRLDKKMDRVVREAGEVGYRWMWREEDPHWSARFEAFWASVMQSGDLRLRILEDRYYDYIKTMEPSGVRYFLEIIEKRLPAYRNIIAAGARSVALDPLLFTAVLIQESRLNEKSVSSTGVRGIMQLTQQTAEHLKVNRMNPEEAIFGGARYLRELWEKLEDMGLDPWDRWFFTLAAFNQGPGRLQGAIALSKKLGGEGRTWVELKEVYPLLGQARYAAMVGQSPFRGGEAVVFVERVRWYYHLLRGLIALERPEAQHLTPLLGGGGGLK